MSKKPAKSSWLTVGRVLKTFQLHGLVKIESYCDDPRDIFSYGPWRINQKHYDAVDARPTSSQLIAQIQSIDHIDLAQHLCQYDIEVPLECIQTSNDDVFWHELEGMTVSNTEGLSMGHVHGLTRVHDNDILIIKDDNGHDTLVPYNQDFINSVSKDNNHLVIYWPNEDHND